MAKKDSLSLFLCDVTAEEVLREEPTGEFKSAVSEESAGARAAQRVEERKFRVVENRRKNASERAKGEGYRRGPESPRKASARTHLSCQSLFCPWTNSENAR